MQRHHLLGDAHAAGAEPKAASDWFIRIRRGCQTPEDEKISAGKSSNQEEEKNPSGFFESPKSVKLPEKFQNNFIRFSSEFFSQF